MEIPFAIGIAQQHDFSALQQHHHPYQSVKKKLQITIVCEHHMIETLNYNIQEKASDIFY